MVMRSLSALVALVCMTAVSTDAYTVTVNNRCADKIELFKTAANERSTTDGIAPGATKDYWIAPGKQATLRHSQSDQASLAEFSAIGGSWFDISLIPPGPGWCTSFDDCKRATGGKTGFNKAMQIRPKWNQNGNRCKTITCHDARCADAYLFPKDDLKTFNCPANTDFELVFCPGGPGGPTPAPTPAPTPKPTPPPTPAPTPEPTTEKPTTAPPAEVAGEASSGSGTSLRGPENEAGVLESTTAPVPTEAAPVIVPVGTPAVQEANTQSKETSATATSFVVVGILAGVAMMAGAAIFVVRKKKAQLEAMDLKTPDPRMTITLAGARGTQMKTPQNFIDVL